MFDQTASKKKVLKSIMAMCDDAMLNPLKKKKEAAIILEKEPAEEDESQELEVMEEKPSESTLSDEELKKLIELYTQSK